MASAWSAAVVVLFICHLSAHAHASCVEGCRCFHVDGLRAANCSSLIDVSDIAANLQVLRVSQSRSIVNPSSFSSFPRLKRLYLDHVGVHSLRPEAFRGLDQLEVLDLSHNHLSDLSKVMEALVEIPQLRKLRLRGNPLGSLEAAPFHLTLDSLTFLDLGFCNIHSIPQRAFLNLTNLRHLKLDRNLITTFSALNFPRSIVTLDLSHNVIKNFSTHQLQSLDRLERLDLSGNPVHCTCELLGIRRELSSDGSVLCGSPTQLKGKNLMHLHEDEVCPPQVGRAKREASEQENGLTNEEQDEPLTHSQDEEAAKEEHHDEYDEPENEHYPSNEELVDEPQNEKHGESANEHDDPANEEHNDEPAKEDNSDKPAKDEHTDDTAKDEHKEEPSNDEHSDEPENEETEAVSGEKHIEPANEEHVDQSISEDREVEHVKDENNIEPDNEEEHVEPVIGESHDESAQEKHNDKLVNEENHVEPEELVHTENDDETADEKQSDEPGNKENAEPLNEVNDDDANEKPNDGTSNEEQVDDGNEEHSIESHVEPSNEENVMPVNEVVKDELDEPENEQVGGKNDEPSNEEGTPNNSEKEVEGEDHHPVQTLPENTDDATADEPSEVDQKGDESLQNSESKAEEEMDASLVALKEETGNVDLESELKEESKEAAGSDDKVSAREGGDEVAGDGQSGEASRVSEEVVQGAEEQTNVDDDEEEENDDAIYPMIGVNGDHSNEEKSDDVGEENGGGLAVVHALSEMNEETAEKEDSGNVEETPKKETADVEGEAPESEVINDVESDNTETKQSSDLSNDDYNEYKEDDLSVKDENEGDKTANIQDQVVAEVEDTSDVDNDPSGLMEDTEEDKESGGDLQPVGEVKQSNEEEENASEQTENLVSTEEDGDSNEEGEVTPVGTVFNSMSESAENKDEVEKTSDEDQGSEETSPAAAQENEDESEDGDVAESVAELDSTGSDAHESEASPEQSHDEGEPEDQDPFLANVSGSSTDNSLLHQQSETTADDHEDDDTTQHNETSTVEEQTPNTIVEIDSSGDEQDGLDFNEKSKEVVGPLEPGNSTEDDTDVHMDNDRTDLPVDVRNEDKSTDGDLYGGSGDDFLFNSTLDDDSIENIEGSADGDLNISSIYIINVDDSYVNKSVEVTSFRPSSVETTTEQESSTEASEVTSLSPFLKSVFVKSRMSNVGSSPGRFNDSETDSEVTKEDNPPAPIEETEVNLLHVEGSPGVESEESSESPLIPDDESTDSQSEVALGSVPIEGETAVVGKERTNGDMKSPMKEEGVSSGDAEDEASASKSSKNSTSSYIVLGVIMAVIVVLLGYSVFRSRRQRSATKKKEKDAENPGRELQEVNKPLMGNGHAPEKPALDDTKQPLMSKEDALINPPDEDDDVKKPIFGNGITHGAVIRGSNDRLTEKEKTDVPEVVVEKSPNNFATFLTASPSPHTNPFLQKEGSDVPNPFGPVAEPTDDEVFANAPVPAPRNATPVLQQPPQLNGSAPPVRNGNSVSPSSGRVVVVQKELSVPERPVLVNRSSQPPPEV